MKKAKGSEGDENGSDAENDVCSREPAGRRSLHTSWTFLRVENAR